MHILRGESLRQLNTLGLQSRADASVSVGSERELIEALGWASDNDMAVIVLGQGSNVVLAGDLNALVIHQAQRGIEVQEDSDDEVVLKIAGGENWHSLVQWSLDSGYYGLENLALIPGTVGAAPIQNIGAYGVEIAPFIRGVNAINIQSGQAITLAASDCAFGYRDSVFKGGLRDKLVITSVEIALSKKPCLHLGYPALRNYLDNNIDGDLTPQTLFNAVVSIRMSRLPDPVDIPNAGSFFKNPVVDRAHLKELCERAPDLPRYPQANGHVKVPAAWLIDQCGWKGKRVGDFGVHPEHALVLVNYGGSDGLALLALAEDIRRSVSEAFHIDLEIEPRVYGLG